MNESTGLINDYQSRRNFCSRNWVKLSALGLAFMFILMFTIPIIKMSHRVNAEMGEMREMVGGLLNDTGLNNVDLNQIVDDLYYSTRQNEKYILEIIDLLKEIAKNKNE